MPEYLILKCQGAMQAWGGHTYEDFRPSLVFPTRSAVVGLLGACLGIPRQQPEQLKQLDNSFQLTVLSHPRLIETSHLAKTEKNNSVSMVKITDYHTVLNARRSDGKKREDAIVSRREYLCDAEFTLALFFHETDMLQRVIDAIKKPVFTPFLGRRSCPLQRPLFEQVIRADSAQQALRAIESSGTIYSEIKIENSYPMQVRDIALYMDKRRFVSRPVYAQGG